MPSLVLSWLVFIVVEVLGIVGFFGNVCLLVTIYRWRHYRFPSFLLIGSLALADTYHCLHTSTYFYPAIVLWPHGPDPQLHWILLMNALDWTAWGVTLTHMVGLSFDRFMAIVKYRSYKQYVTTRNVAVFIAVAWLFEGAVAVVLVVTRSCCPMIPAPESLSFDYVTMESWSIKTNSSATTNVYNWVYMPQEIASIVLLLVLNPMSVFSLYRRRRKTITQSSPGKRRYKRDLRVYMQIGIVVAVYFSYMTAYYLTLHLGWEKDLRVTLFNSFLYNINNMINPIVYVAVNRHLRLHFLNTMSFGLVKVPLSNRRLDSCITPAGSRKGTLTSIRTDRSETITSLTSQ